MCNCCHSVVQCMYVCMYTEGSFTLEMSSLTSEICLEMYRNLEIIHIAIWKLEIRSKRNLIGFAAPEILCTIETCKN